MKIRYDIVGGHKRALDGLDAYAATKPQLSMDEAAVEWVGIKFGSWINRNITDSEYRFTEVSSDWFDVDFTYEDDGKKFLKLLGGRNLEANNG